MLKIKCMHFRDIFLSSNIFEKCGMGKLISVSSLDFKFAACHLAASEWLKKKKNLKKSLLLSVNKSRVRLAVRRWANHRVLSGIYPPEPWKHQSKLHRWAHSGRSHLPVQPLRHSEPLLQNRPEIRPTINSQPSHHANEKYCRFKCYLLALVADVICISVHGKPCRVVVEAGSRRGYRLTLV